MVLNISCSVWLQYLISDEFAAFHIDVKKFDKLVHAFIPANQCMTVTERISQGLLHQSSR